jgi:hypothetical protein
MALRKESRLDLASATARFLRNEIETGDFADKVEAYSSSANDDETLRYVAKELWLLYDDIHHTKNGPCVPELPYVLRLVAALRSDCELKLYPIKSDVSLRVPRGIMIAALCIAGMAAIVTKELIVIIAAWVVIGIVSFVLEHYGECGAQREVEREYPFAPFRSEKEWATYRTCLNEPGLEANAISAEGVSNWEFIMVVPWILWFPIPLMIRLIHGENSLLLTVPGCGGPTANLPT